MSDNVISIDGIQYYCLTKRELFAAMAMQGMLSYGYASHPDRCAQQATVYADALIAELEKKNGPA